MVVVKTSDCCTFTAVMVVLVLLLVVVQVVEFSIHNLLYYSCLVSCVFSFSHTLTKADSNQLTKRNDKGQKTKPKERNEPTNQEERTK